MKSFDYSRIVLVQVFLNEKGTEPLRGFRPFGLVGSAFSGAFLCPARRYAHFKNAR